MLREDILSFGEREDRNDSLSRVRRVDGSARTVVRGDVLDVARLLHVGRRRSERLAVLHRAEERVPVPLVGAAHKGRPGVDLGLRRTNVVHAVHCRGASEELAARPGDVPSVCVGLDYGLVSPVV